MDNQFEKINEELGKALFKNYPEMVKRVQGQKMCDIDGSFLGFVDTYYYLSKIIPLNWTVIDFGCAYNPQAYFFRKHKKFIGVDFVIRERFKFENTVLFEGKISDYLKTKPNDYMVFAICNNVPSDEAKLVREYFQDCFIFYIKGVC